MWVSKASAAGLLVLLFVAAAGAQGGRTSTMEPNVSLKFSRYLEPFAQVDTPEECRDVCINDKRCSGWTYYHSTFKGGVRHLRMCVVGTGLQSRKADMDDRTSGVIKQEGAPAKAPRKPRKTKTPEQQQ
jgi:hypothetical protein